MTDIPEIPVKKLPRSLWERVSVVWLIPAAALLIALGVAWQSYSERGPLIVISFDSASGVKAGETALRYRDVIVGQVEKVSFSPTLEKVDVSVRLDKEIAPFVDEDAQFWVVRPEVTAQGVSGLDTVLTGVFIEGLWNTTPDGLKEVHQGRSDAPLLRVGESGLRIILKAQGSSVLTEATPILFKGIVVGRMGKPRLSGDGTEAVAEAVIYAPHDALINSSTRFWDTSGFSFKIGAGGAELDFSSIASLISGGVTFGTIVSGGDSVAFGHEFDVFPDEAAARDNVFSASTGPTLTIAAVFEENVSGLSEGSPVDYNGVRIGEVTGMRGMVDQARFGDARVRLVASMEIRPERLGLDEGTSAEAALAFLKERVADGLRARLATASILTGGLKIELLRVEGAPAAALETPADGLPTVPTTDSNVQDVAASAQGVLKRVNDLPIEELIGSVIGFLDNASTLVGSQDMQSVPGQISGLIADARGVIGSDEVQKLPANLNNLLTGLQASVDDLQKILNQVEQADAVNRLLASIDKVGEAATEAGDSLDGVPELVANLSALTNKAKELPVEDLIVQVTRIVETTEGLLASDDAKDLPGALAGALTELQAVLGELRAGGTVENANKTLASAASAADALATATADLPSLVERINSLVNTAATTISGFDAQSDVNREMREALREIQKAAQAVTSLSRALERRPNSIIIGR